MIQRDYILKMLEEFFQAMAKIVRHREAGGLGGVASLQERFNRVYEQFFRQPAEHFYALGKEDILDDIWEANSEQDAYAKMQMLSELFYQDALIKDDIPERCQLLEKSLYLLRFIQQNSRTYSWEREIKMADIRKRIDEYEIK